MKKAFPILLFWAIMCSCVSTKIQNYKYNKKQSSVALIQDVLVLKKVLEANHPSLYWHTSKDSLDYYFSIAQQKIAAKDSLTEIEFKNIVAEAVSKIKCGHTSVRFSKQFADQSSKHRYPSFPLLLKVWNDSLVVLRNMHNDSIFKRGTIVTSINNYSNRTLIDSMFSFISTDGNGDNFKNQVLSSNFSLWYKNSFGIDTVYNVKYIDSAGIERTALVKNYFPPKPDTTVKKDSVKRVVQNDDEPTRKEKRQAKLLEKRSMLIDTSISTAYIRLNTFSSGRLRKFFKKSLRKIKEDSIENVVIDLRANGGGSVGVTTKLLKYFANKPFKHGDTVAAVTRNLSYKKHIQNWWLYWVPMHFFATKKKDGLIHYRRYEKHYFTPYTKKHFNGNVYIVQGGASFSASTMFISTLKGQENVTVVGEETGGGYYGNSAMHIPTIILPNSKLRVSLPLYKLVMNKNRPKGNGISPDVEIPPSSAAIKDGYDIKLFMIRQRSIDKKEDTEQKNK